MEVLHVKAAFVPLEEQRVTFQVGDIEAEMILRSGSTDHIPGDNGLLAGEILLPQQIFLTQGQLDADVLAGRNITLWSRDAETAQPFSFVVRGSYQSGEFLTDNIAYVCYEDLEQIAPVQPREETVYCIVVEKSNHIDAVRDEIVKNISPEIEQYVADQQFNELYQLAGKISLALLWCAVAFVILLFYLAFCSILTEKQMLTAWLQCIGYPKRALYIIALTENLLVTCLAYLLSIPLSLLAFWGAAWIVEGKTGQAVSLDWMWLLILLLPMLLLVLVMTAVTQFVKRTTSSVKVLKDS